VIAFVGGSNVGGYESGVGEFGTNPYSLRAGVTLWKDGVQLGAYSTVHGPEVGLVERLYAVDPDLLTGLVILNRAVFGASTQSWYTTHNATAVADAVAAGVRPNVVVGHVPNADTTTAALGAALEQWFPLAYGGLLSAWGPDCGLILDGPLLEDDGTNPGNDAARASARKWTQGTLTSQRAWVDAHADLVNLQSDGLHRRTEAMYAFGVRVADVLIHSGILGGTP
jgi:hypothetical protein